MKIGHSFSNKLHKKSKLPKYDINKSWSSFDLNGLKNGSAKYFKNCMKSLHFFQGLIWRIYRWGPSKLIQACEQDLRYFLLTVLIQCWLSFLVKSLDFKAVPYFQLSQDQVKSYVMISSRWKFDADIKYSIEGVCKIQSRQIRYKEGKVWSNLWKVKTYFINHYQEKVGKLETYLFTYLLTRQSRQSRCFFTKAK